MTVLAENRWTRLVVTCFIHLALSVAVVSAQPNGPGSAPIPDPQQTRYRIETIAGNGQPGDAPAETTTPLQVPVDLPFGVEYGPDGALYITAIGSHRVFRLDSTTGKMNSVAGTGTKGLAAEGVLATEAPLFEPYEVRFDSQGNMLILEMRNHLLRRVDRKTGVMTTVAGDGILSDQGDGGPANRARLHYPHCFTLDPEDNIFIGDILNHRVRRVDARTGMIETVVGTGREGVPRDGGIAKQEPLTTPQGIAVFEGGLWLSSSRLNRIWRVDLKTGIIRHQAGTGERGYRGDGGDPLQATFDGPRGMKITPKGILYLAEGENNLIRAFNLRNGTIWTVAGVGPREHRFVADGIAATLAPIWQPHGVCVSSDQSLIFSDTINHRVRRLIPIEPESKSKQ